MTALGQDSPVRHLYANSLRVKIAPHTPLGPPCTCPAPANTV